MEVVKWRKEEQVAIVEMCSGANRMNKTFSSELNRCLDEAVADPQVQSLILTSTDEKNFSQGIDVEWMGQALMAGDLGVVTEFLFEMNDVFKKLIIAPVPTIAMINGHAFGNGAVISCACDFRFMRKDKGFFCFPEVDVNIPFFPGMLAFIRKAIPETFMNRIMLSGQRLGAQELEDESVIVKACENLEDLEAQTLAFAQGFAKGRGIFQELKKRMHKEVIRTLEEEDPKLFRKPDQILVK